MPDSRNEVDPVFGPPATMGRFGTGNRQCRRCQVSWHTDGDGELCWVCGGAGELGYKSFAGAAQAYVNEPPRHMWKELGWQGPAEEAS